MNSVPLARHLFAIVLLFPGGPLICGTAFAQSRIWEGAANGTWNNSGGGWSGNIPPQTTDNVYIDQNLGQQSTVSLTVDASIRGLYVSSGDTLRITEAKQLGITGVTYGAQTSENLGTWSPVPDTGTGGVHTFSQADESKSRRYMRLTVTASN